MAGVGFLLMILGPPIIGLFFGVLQLIVYMLLEKTGRITKEQIPFFPILWLKGMLVVVVIGVIMAINGHLG